MENFKPGDVVLIRSRAGNAIPQIHVRLIKRHHRKKREVKVGRWDTKIYPEYYYWDAELVYEEEVDVLRKRWSIPFSFPDNIQTSVFEQDIIKKVRKNKKRRARNSYNKSAKKKTNKTGK